ncbi:2-phospho-L-lactate guanylyltransferase [Gordonia humi]|uniref:Phosphoenolpyruvate guanylyltransferase n=1 Tax=Gordonia humi TaxID=686429 RepID=A0A840EZR0_9ACTN|nr:2-phospho-L-lactate guanylyltransferase [Gordonia humi]MBB4137122.1 2-phospho-L-lactate guanylyltransferase [Gordonia humi]
MPSLAASDCAVVLAVKSLAAAKSRLAPLPATTDRGALVAAMLVDTLAAVRGAGIDEVLVVSPDPLVHALTAEAGAHPVPEPEPQPRLSSLNAALAHGARAATHSTVAYLQADLPALRGESLVAALDAARCAGDSAAFVADRAGSGTVLLVAGPDFVPRFGVGSAEAHRAAGAVELDPPGDRWPDLRTDIDTPADLVAAVHLGVGARTGAVLDGRTGAASGSAGQRRANTAQ